MPIHLYWGDDATARERAVQELIDQIIEPAWLSLNLSRLDGSSADQAAQALNEARTAPFGGGGRVVLLQRSPFCERCPAELAEQLESALPLIPEQSHLVLVSAGKPDARLRTTKALRKVAEEKKFPLPAIWDGAGLIELVQRSAAAAQLQLEPAAAELLADTIGNDSSRLAGELEKLALYCGEKAVDVAAVKALAGPAQHNALAVGEALLAGDVGGALTQIDGLMAANEPPLRLVASLVSQLRGWLWLTLLEQSGEQDPMVIAKAAGIGNPKRIYVMRKQLRGVRPQRLLKLLGRLLDVEAALKLGSPADVAFRDGLLGQSG